MKKETTTPTAKKHGYSIQNQESWLLVIEITLVMIPRTPLP